MLHCKHFVTYSGIQLPLNLLDPLTESDIANRNTYFRAYYDATARMVLCEKVVYGEVALQHRYTYRADGSLLKAEITEAEEAPRVLHFD